MIIQYIIIFGISYLGEVLSSLLKLPIPGTIVGMIFLFIVLHFKMIKVSKIEEAVDTLIINMSLFFVPPGVKLINSLDYLNGNWTKIIILMLVTTIITIGITGRVVQYLIEKGEKNGTN